MCRAVCQTWRLTSWVSCPRIRQHVRQVAAPYSNSTKTPLSAHCRFNQMLVLGLSLYGGSGLVHCRWFNQLRDGRTSVMLSHRSSWEQPSAQWGRYQTLIMCQPWLGPSRVGHTLNINLIGPGWALLTYGRHQTEMSLFPQSTRTLRIKDNNIGSNLL